MSLKSYLSKISNNNLKNLLIDIAKKDGGQNKDEIDSKLGYRQLSDLLSNNAYSDDKDILLGLKVEYEKANIASNSNNKIGNVGRTNNGNVIIGSTGVAVGGDGSINVTGKDNTVITGNNNTIIVADIEANKIAISTDDKISGQTAAKEIYNETVDSWVAFNDRIVKSINNINNKNAYSFFKEYNKLRSNNPNLFQDIFNVTDPRNVITNKEVVHLMRSLLSQAKGIVSPSSDACKNLQNYIKLLDSSADPEGSQSIQFDYAIQQLIDEMSKKIKD